MKKKLLALTIVILSHNTYANSCLPLYEKKAEEIQKKMVIKKEWEVTYTLIMVSLAIGLELKYPHISITGQEISYTPLNGVQHFSLTLKDDPKKEWLESFRKSIKDDCKLPHNNYDHLRAMLSELMEDGSFCPNQKIIDPGIFGGKSEFKKVLQSAVKDQRFSHYCADKAVKDDSDRVIKSLDEESIPSKSHRTKETSKQ